MISWSSHIVSLYSLPTHFRRMSPITFSSPVSTSKKWGNFPFVPLLWPERYLSYLYLRNVDLLNNWLIFVLKTFFLLHTQLFRLYNQSFGIYKEVLALSQAHWKRWSLPLLFQYPWIALWCYKIWPEVGLGRITFSVCWSNQDASVCSSDAQSSRR